MAYAFVHDIATSWYEYTRLARRTKPPRRGLLLEAAGPTDEGVRIIGIWRTQADWHARGRDDHMSELAALGVGDTARSFREIPTAVLVLGELTDRASDDPLAKALT